MPLYHWQDCLQAPAAVDDHSQICVVDFIKVKGRRNHSKRGFNPFKTCRRETKAEDVPVAFSQLYGHAENRARPGDVRVGLHRTRSGTVLRQGTTSNGQYSLCGRNHLYHRLGEDVQVFLSDAQTEGNGFLLWRNSTGPDRLAHHRNAR